MVVGEERKKLALQEVESARVAGARVSQGLGEQELLLEDTWAMARLDQSSGTSLPLAADWK